MVSKSEDELSFKEFSRQLQKLGLFIKNSVQQYLKEIKKNYLVFILLFIATAAAVFFIRHHEKVYKATAAYIYNDLQKKTYGEMMDKLQYMIETGSYKQLAIAINLPLYQAQQILSINALNIYGARLSEDLTENVNTFYVCVEANSNLIYDSLQYGIENYLNNNILVKSITAINIQKTEEKLRYRKNELIMLDTFVSTYTRSLEKPVTTAYPPSKDFNPVQLFDKGEKIAYDISDIQAYLKTYKAVQLKDKFLVSETPLQSSLLRTFLKILLTFFIISILSIVLITMFKK